MLTVDYDRLDVRASQCVLDLGCGGGRHAFEALARGAVVVAVDMGADELGDVRAWFDAVAAEAQQPTAGWAVQADGLRLPFADATFDRIIAAEVLEHIPDDSVVFDEIKRVLRPGGRVAVTVPRFWPELLCWVLSKRYHQVEGGHVRIYRRRQLRRRAGAVGLRWRSSHHAHALHSPYWWLKCAVGIERDTWPVRAYHRLLVWDMLRAPALTRVSERLLNPVLGKSTVVYLEPEGTS